MRLSVAPLFRLFSGLELAVAVSSSVGSLLSTSRSTHFSLLSEPASRLLFLDDEPLIELRCCCCASCWLLTRCSMVFCSASRLQCTQRSSGDGELRFKADALSDARPELDEDDRRTKSFHFGICRADIEPERFLIMSRPILLLLGDSSCWFGRPFMQAAEIRPAVRSSNDLDRLRPGVISNVVRFKRRSLFRFFLLICSLTSRLPITDGSARIVVAFEMVLEITLEIVFSVLLSTLPISSLSVSGTFLLFILLTGLSAAVFSAASSETRLLLKSDRFELWSDIVLVAAKCQLLFSFPISCRKRISSYETERLRLVRLPSDRSSAACWL